MGELKTYRVGAQSASHTCRFSARTSSQVNIRTPVSRRQIAMLRRGNGALHARPPGPQASAYRHAAVDTVGGHGERG